MIKHFVSLASFSVSDIQSLIDRAQYFSLHISQPDKIQHLLKNKIIVNAFYEPSTRTRCSFEMAAKRLGAEVINFVPENSSVKKGETIYDTLKTLESLGADGIVLRHSDDNVFSDLYEKFNTPLLNAGAGKYEHPSQGLLDLLTLKQEFGKLEGLKIAVCGDIKHSRVAGSLMVAAEKFGMEIYLCGPEAMLPNVSKPFIKKANFEEVLPIVDAVMMLRIQLERHASLELDAKAYHTQFGLTSERVNKMRKDAIIMHPGPFNRGVEIADEIVEHKQSRIFKQMGNGVFARMAILEWALGGSK
ncbi:aspartate carbamoyltransferase catalytic subunit [Peredibacter starrii]|uniref:Aspartate carbamoyltransferase n=1 Tax=Peredibacter starrii TaxID=28202 RepID=A0AAX4HSD8_9BACT|nr:aspartate carbamoyltransferase catalytic subunit [Peredibacter starrii]WPU66280.1 aspartate carbamoyltransferase catalytic subunit [Peredibacter starrii]